MEVTNTRSCLGEEAIIIIIAGTFPAIFLSCKRVAYKSMQFIAKKIIQVLDISILMKQLID